MARGGRRISFPFPQCPRRNAVGALRKTGGRIKGARNRLPKINFTLVVSYEKHSRTARIKNMVNHLPRSGACSSRHFVNLPGRTPPVNNWTCPRLYSPVLGISLTYQVALRQSITGPVPVCILPVCILPNSQLLLSPPTALQKAITSPTAPF
jgi:hypothetical protein